jgi:GNAT superfamily N-acetyltransferase
MRKSIITHHLEMTDPSQFVPARKPATSFALVQAEIPCPALHRFLYTAVGGAWHWLDRLAWSYEQWQVYLERTEVETWIAYVSGTPAGYCELEMQADGNVEIVYFGLLPQFIGRGLGGAVLTATVERAWALGARRVWGHTCSLDHPNALPGYQARGFRWPATLEHREDGRGVHHDIGHTPGQQRAMQPEAIAPGLVTAHDGHALGPPKAGFGLGHRLPHGGEIPRSNGDDASFVAIAQRQFLLFVAKFQRHE